MVGDRWWGAAEGAGREGRGGGGEDNVGSGRKWAEGWRGEEGHQVEGVGG